jgi:hypothetical protein
MPKSADSGHVNGKKALQRRGSKRMLTSHHEEGAHESSEEEEVERENHHSSSNNNSVKMNQHNTDREHDGDGDVDKSNHFRQRNEIIFIGSNVCLLFLSFGVLLYLLSYSKDECPTL